MQYAPGLHQRGAGAVRQEADDSASERVDRGRNPHPGCRGLLMIRENRGLTLDFPMRKLIRRNMMVAQRVYSLSYGVLVLSAVALICVAPRVSSAATFTFTPIDVPGATSTEVDGINAAGQLVGVYEDSGGTDHGFVLDRGTFTTIDVPGATFTEVIGINGRRQLSGLYGTASTQHGLLFADGVFTTIDPPGSTFTQATGINAAGQIVGRYLNGIGSYHGFVLDKGSFTSFDVPSATET